jgi:rare lipoprotein A
MVTSRAGSHRLLARLGYWGYLFLLFVECRTPPPLPRAPADAVSSEAPPASKPAKAVEPEKRAAPPETAPPEPDFAAEQVALRERYGSQRSQGALRGEASYYGAAFAGRRTANGEIFDPRRYTAAHRTLPFGTVLRVTRLDTGKTVYVRVNDRGPFGKKRRILDLSEAAAAELEMLKRGIAEIRAEVVEKGKKPAKKSKKSKKSAAL